MKPATSKPGNSEIYVVCVSYLGINEAVLEYLFSHIGIHHFLLISINTFTMGSIFYYQEIPPDISVKKRSIAKITAHRKDFLLVIVVTMTGSLYDNNCNLKKLI